MAKTKKRRSSTKKRKNPITPITMQRNPQARRKTLENIVIKEGPVSAMKKLEGLAKTHPDLATDIWEDAKWVVRNPFPQKRRNPRKLISGDPAMSRMLDEPIRSFPRRTRNPLPKRSVRRSRLRRNPDFEWGPKVFDPFKDKHPFGKRPTTTRINPAPRLRRRNRRSRIRNPRRPGARVRARAQARTNPTKMFDPIYYARNRQKRRNRKIRWKR